MAITHDVLRDQSWLVIVASHKKPLSDDFKQMVNFIPQENTYFFCFQVA